MLGDLEKTSEAATFYRYDHISLGFVTPSGYLIHCHTYAMYIKLCCVPHQIALYMPHLKKLALMLIDYDAT